MKTLHFSTWINAPADVVWNTMLDDATYRQWTGVFSPGSHFVGSWSPGSEIRFLGSSEPGDEGGMIGVIREHRPYQFVSIEYRGQIVNGVDDTESADARRMIGAHENYTFRESDGVTHLTVDADVDEEWLSMMSEQWPQGLAVLTALAEEAAGTQGRHPPDATS